MHRPAHADRERNFGAEPAFLVMNTMRTGIRKPTRQRPGRRPRRRRRDEETAPLQERPPTPELPEPAARRPNGPEDRGRLAGGPQDRALYVCRCGSAFQADVSASVTCPHCGDPQAW